VAGTRGNEYRKPANKLKGSLAVGAKGNKSRSEGSNPGVIVIWKPSYTLYRKKIIVYIPRERTIYNIIKGV
jgi:hypothetical protein